MPRARWIPENRYCKRSKISEDLFCSLVHSYFGELINHQSREYAVSLHSVLLPQGKKAISSQTIGRYYELFGNFIWNHVITPVFLEDAISIEKHDLFHLFYSKNKQPEMSLYFPALVSPTDFKTIPFERSFMYVLLMRRSKQIRGFRQSTFYLEYSRAAFIEMMLATLNLQYYPDKLFVGYTPDLDTSSKYRKLTKKVETACGACLLNMLERAPLK